MADLSPKQWEAWQLLDDSRHTEVLYGGAAGGGKSWLGCLWLLGNCVRYKGSRWLMGRSELKTLRETTLNSFFDVCAQGGLVAGRDYVYNGQTNVISVAGSTIILKDLFAYPSDPNFDSLGSLEITGAFIDEANQVTEKSRAIVGSRIRYKLDEFGIIPKLLMTCNPAKNWVYRDFYMPWRRKDLPEHMAFVPALVTDNPNISPHYIDNLKRLTGPDRERLLMGNWDYDDAEWQLMSTDAIFGLWVNHDLTELGKPALTWDVAGPGSDRSIAMIWDGFMLTHVYTLEGEDINVQAREVEALASKHKIPRNKMIVDATGIGTGPSQYLRGCIAFNGGESPLLNKDFKNLKSECSFLLAKMVNDGAFGIACKTGQDDIARELSLIRQWKGDSDMRIQVIPKQEVRKDLGHSPDYADNFVMRVVTELRPRTDIFERSIMVANERELDKRRERFREDLASHFPK